VGLPLDTYKRFYLRVTGTSRIGMPKGEQGLAAKLNVYVPLISDLAPDGFFYGGHYIIEYDPDSLWYETSLTIAALALKRGTKVEYHTFQHFPDEVVEAFSKVGVDASKFEERGLLKLIDSYTQTIEYQNANRGTESFRVARGDTPLDLVKSAENWAKEAIAGYLDKDKRWLHIDDNTGIFLRYNDERILIDKWRTAILPYSVRARETPHLIAFAKGVATDWFYSQFETQCDGVIELKTKDEGGRIENYIRIRTLKGKIFDSSWHRIQLASNGEVTFAPASPARARRLAAIMYSDMVGYTSLGQRDESLSLALVREQRELIRAILPRHNGREVKTMGDGFLVEFPNALDAVKCAYEIQKSTRDHNASIATERRIHLRVGIHLGDVVDSGGDILGDAVNIASRIEPLADDGGVCLTRQVYDQVLNKFELPLISLGSMPLKNVTVPSEVFKMVMPWSQGKGPS
jgi:class 3 adenylate cyclase